MDSIFGFLASARKAVATAVGGLLTVLTFAHSIPFLPSGWVGFMGVAIAFLTAVATYVVPNDAA